MNKKPLIAKKYILQVLSVFSAIVLWFAVTYSVDPEINLTITNITLNTIGENNLDKNDLIFVDRDKLPPLSIDVRGRRGDVKSILNSVSATIDLSDITEAGEYTKQITFSVPNSSVMIIRSKSSTIDVNIENAVTKEVPVYIQQIGADKNKDYIIQSTPVANTVKIKGTSSDVSSIKEACLSVDVSNMTINNSDRYSVGFADSDHSAITAKNKVISNLSSIVVSNKVYVRKTVPIVLNPDIDISGYQVIVKSFSKDKIEIGIDADKADEVDAIYANFASDITSAESGKYQMKLIFPEYIYYPGKNDEIFMNADIEEITTEPFLLDVATENVPSGLTATVTPQEIKVELTGAKSKMKDVEAKVDLSGLDVGVYQLPVIFITDGTGVIVNSSATVTIEIQ